LDGTRNQAAIIKQVGINQGQLSSLISDLRKEGLLEDGGSGPCLVLNSVEVKEAFGD
jgi:hypothetical protein